METDRKSACVWHEGKAMSKPPIAPKHKITMYFLLTHLKSDNQPRHTAPNRSPTENADTRNTASVSAIPLSLAKSTMTVRYAMKITTLQPNVIHIDK